MIKNFYKNRTNIPYPIDRERLYMLHSKKKANIIHDCYYKMSLEKEI